jgi:hypothetical protein
MIPNTFTVYVAEFYMFSATTWSDDHYTITGRTREEVEQLILETVQSVYPREQFDGLLKEAKESITTEEVTYPSVQTRKVR